MRKLEMTLFGLAFAALATSALGENPQKPAAADPLVKEGAQIRKAAADLCGIANTAADATFARTFHLLARNHIAQAKQSWFDREHKPAGQRLRAAADSLENALKASGDRANDAAVATIKESRLVSGKFVEGGGYAVDEAGHAFEGLGKQITGLGERIESPDKKPRENL